MVIEVFTTARALTPTIGMLWNAPSPTSKYFFGLGMQVLFLSKLNRPMKSLNLILGYVLVDECHVPK